MMTKKLYKAYVCLGAKKMSFEVSKPMLIEGIKTVVKEIWYTDNDNGVIQQITVFFDNGNEIAISNATFVIHFKQVEVDE